MNVSFLGACDDVDRGAIHVHLTVADPIEPSPREGVLSRFNASRNCIGEIGGARARGVVAQITIGSKRTSALDRMNHAPLGILGRFLVWGKRYLARAPTVCGSTDEGELLRRSDRQLIEIESTFDFVDTRALLARKIRSIRG